ncbi:hypothetical protein CL616_01250 [archaeon]|nr:hypothetical protein [archaeon]
MIVNGDDYKEFVLDNGLQVGIKLTPALTSYGYLSIHSGTVHEEPGEEGLAHFLEHCLIGGGTRKFSPDLTRAITSRFDWYNAQTAFEETRIIVDILTEDIPLFLDYAAEVAFNPTLDQKIVDQERQRVLREIADNKSSPEFVAMREYRNKVFGSHPVNRYGLGSEDIVRNTTREDLEKIHKRRFGASNMKLILVGAMPDDIETLVHENFANKPTGEKKEPNIYPKLESLEETFVLERSAPELLNRDSPKESTAIMLIAAHAPSYEDEDYRKVQLLSTVLGEGANSRLFRELSMQRGLVYSVSADYDGSNNAGLISINGKIAANKTDEAREAIFNVFKDLRERKISETELAQIRKRARYQVAKSFESNSGIAGAIWKRWIWDITPESYLAELDAITVNDIREMANKYLAEDATYGILIRNPLKKDK